MFSIDDATIRAVHGAHARGGELVAVVELRERFPGISSNAAAADCVRRIIAVRDSLARFNRFPATPQWCPSERSQQASLRLVGHSLRQCSPGQRGQLGVGQV